MSQQTALDFYIDKMNAFFDEAGVHCGLRKNDEIYQQAKQMFEDQLKEAMHYALDEDGHTGDWRNRFVNNYYIQKFKDTDNEKK